MLNSVLKSAKDEFKEAVIKVADLGDPKVLESSMLKKIAKAKDTNDLDNILLVSNKVKEAFQKKTEEKRLQDQPN